MVIFKGARRFEMTVDEADGEWVVKCYEYVLERPTPTLHLLRCCTSRQAAIDAVVRKWRLLFPDEAPLVWREPPQIMPRSRPQKGPRRAED
jgi:hypothetical protein